MYSAEGQRSTTALWSEEQTVTKALSCGNKQGIQYHTFLNLFLQGFVTPITSARAELNTDGRKMLKLAR